MNSVFISHSRGDRDILQLFENAFARSNVKAHLLEFENYQVPPWSDIKAKITQAASVFLILGPGVTSNPYTQNWVAWEAGVACALNKPLLVFEARGEEVAFPVPYCTDYVPYNRPADLQYIKKLVDSFDPLPRLGKGALVALLVAAFGGAPLLIASSGLATFAATAEKVPTTNVHCPYAACGVRFRLHGPPAPFPCPACRQAVQFN